VILFWKIFILSTVFIWTTAHQYGRVVKFDHTNFKKKARSPKPKGVQVKELVYEVLEFSSNSEKYPGTVDIDLIEIILRPLILVFRFIEEVNRLDR